MSLSIYLAFELSMPTSTETNTSTLAEGVKRIPITAKDSAPLHS